MNMQHWNKLPRQVVESPCLVVSNTQIKKATADLIWSSVGSSPASRESLGQVTCRGPSQPIFLWFFTYTENASKIWIFCGSKKILFVLFLADFLILTDIFFTFFIWWSPGWCSHRSIFMTPELSFLRSNDQILPFHTWRALFLLCSILHLSTLNSTVILLLGYSHKLSCKYQCRLIFINLNNLIASSGFVTWLLICFPDDLWICRIMQHKASCWW